MPKLHEQIPAFKLHTYAYLNETKVYILKIKTYCTCCDQFLKEVTYSIKDWETNEIHYAVPESLLSYKLEEK